jgi:hypothetical protein
MKQYDKAVRRGPKEDKNRLINRPFPGAFQPPTAYLHLSAFWDLKEGERASKDQAYLVDLRAIKSLFFRALYSQCALQMTCRLVSTPNDIILSHMFMTWGIGLG